MYQSATITEVLRKEQCPDNLDTMKQPSVFETDKPKAGPIDSGEDDQKKSTDRPDGTESSDGMNGGGSSTPDQDNGLPSSSNTKHPWDHKKPLDKKDHRGRPSDRPKKKDHLGRPEDKSKPDKYDIGSSNPFSQPGKSGETDDLDYPDGSRPSSLTSQSSQFPKGHRPKKPYQLGPTKWPDHSNLGPDKSDSYGSDKPGTGRSDETDDLDSPSGSHPSQFTSQPPHFTAPFRPTKKPGLTKPNQSGSRPDKSDQYSPDKRPDGSSPYDSNKNPSSPNGSVESPNSPKRPGRSPYSGNQDGYAYPSQTDIPDASDESSGKRVPRRGDIGIQSLDERGG